MSFPWCCSGVIPPEQLPWQLSRHPSPAAPTLLSYPSQYHFTATLPPSPRATDTPAGLQSLPASGSDCGSTVGCCTCVVDRAPTPAMCTHAPRLPPHPVPISQMLICPSSSGCQRKFWINANFKLFPLLKCSFIKDQPLKYCKFHREFICTDRKL